MVRNLALIILVLSVGFIIFQLIKFFLSINNSSAQRRRDLEQLKLQMSGLIKELVPMNNKELELLSVNQKGVVKTGGINTIKTGAFTSVYHEPLLAYAYKTYTYPEQSRVLLVSTSSDDFIYKSKGQSTQVFLNNSELGTIDADGNMYETGSNQLVAKIEADHVLSSHPVKIGDREVGEIVNLRLNESPNPRAYQFLEPMDEKEDKLFKALTFLSLIEETID